MGHSRMGLGFGKNKGKRKNGRGGKRRYVAFAIETEYDGRLFRSRLEARWAVFLNNLQISYMHERDGYAMVNVKTGETLRYLPDFWIVDAGMWAEVKPTELTEYEREKVFALVESTGCPCILMVGEPALRYHTVLYPFGARSIYLPRFSRNPLQDASVALKAALSERFEVEY